jgi:hypothetical protein
LRSPLLATTSALAFVSLLTGLVFAQTPEQPPPPRAAMNQPPPPRSLQPLVALRLQIVLSKFQGEKKVNSLPYSLTVTANSHRPTLLRMGSQVPIAQTVFSAVTAAGDTPAPPVSSYNYRDVGTNIDAQADSTEDGAFSVRISIEDSSVNPGEGPSSTPVAPRLPSFRSFKSEQVLVLRDGQSTLFTSAVDKSSGEVVKAEVTLTVVK